MLRDIVTFDTLPVILFINCLRRVAETSHRDGEEIANFLFIYKHKSNMLSFPRRYSRLTHEIDIRIYIVNRIKHFLDSARNEDTR